MKLLRDEIWKMTNNNVDLKADVYGLDAEIRRLECLLHKKVKAEGTSSCSVSFFFSKLKSLFVA